MDEQHQRRVNEVAEQFADARGRRSKRSPSRWLTSRSARRRPRERCPCIGAGPSRPGRYRA